jgi:fructokinase
MASTPSIAAIGEVLWDRFPDGLRFGGAPANVAVHAAGLGARSILISRVGDDELGRDARKLLADRGVETQLVQVDPIKPTGEAVVSVDAQGEPSFEIVEDAAWDHLEWVDDLEEAADKVDAVCFGTLGQRSDPSRSTIRRLLDAGSPNVIRCLDLNLRQHYHSHEAIEASLTLANALKLNRFEMTVLANLFQQPDEAHRMADYLREAFSLRWLALTLGDAGSRVFAEDVDESVAGVPVEVKDTVGAGDAFTAALLVGLLNGNDFRTAASTANELGSFVASLDGATPDLPLSYRLTQ